MMNVDQTTPTAPKRKMWQERVHSSSRRGREEEE
jgi:hypothetical protein